MKITELIRRRSLNPFDAEPVTIACMGDSVTHGCFEVFNDINGNATTRYSPRESYVQLLQDSLNALFPVAAVNVLNCGISGDRAGKAMKRYRRDVSRFNPDLVVIMYGLNDSVHPGITPADYVRSLRELIEEVRADGAECILLTPNMMGTYVDTSIQHPMLRELAETAVQTQLDGTLSAFVDAAREMAMEMEVPVADAYAQWCALYESGADIPQLMANRVHHPLPFMHEIFKNRVLDCILGITK